MQNGVVWERLAVGGFDHVDPLLTTYEPGGASAVDGRFMRHAGIEYGYIIEGELTLKLEFDSYVLRAGDSLCFDSQRPHLYVNESDTPVRGLWFVLDRNEDAGRRVDRRTAPSTPSPRDQRAAGSTRPSTSSQRSTSDAAEGPSRQPSAPCERGCTEWMRFIGPSTVT